MSNPGFNFIETLIGRDIFIEFTLSHKLFYILCNLGGTCGPTSK